MLTPNVRKNGYGDVEPERLERSIAQIAEGYELPRKPDPKEVFDATFLPSQEDRMVK